MVISRTRTPLRDVHKRAPVFPIPHRLFAADYQHILPDMGTSITNVAHLLLFVSVGVASIGAQAVCSNPSARKEWRTLSVHQRAEWIEAVNVRLPLPESYLKLKPHIQCLSKQPHNHNLVATQPANVSLIPPINQNSSYYDGLSAPIPNTRHAHEVRPLQTWFIYTWTSTPL